MKKFTINNIKIDNIDDKILLDLISSDINDGLRNQYISITNSEAMYLASKNNEQFLYINNSRFSLCDGTGIKISLFFRGYNIKRSHGPDFFLNTINYGQSFGWTHYLYGGKPDVVKNLSKILSQKFPKSKILGFYSPPFLDLNKFNDKKEIEKINKLKPNFVWVSLGLPKQEMWIKKNKNNINSNFLIGVGAAFDFCSNSVKRAPFFLRRIGLEWMYRTLFERRLLFRQIRGFKFMIRTILFGKVKQLK